MGPCSGRYSKEEDILALYFLSRLIYSNVIREIMRLKVGTNRTEKSIRGRVDDLKKRMVAMGYDRPYDSITGLWNLRVVDDCLTKERSPGEVWDLVSFNDSEAQIIFQMQDVADFIGDNMALHIE
ncbi:hypothetical protein ACLMJK_003666 [Lecanora helva]